MDFLVPDTNGTCARPNERRRKVVLTRKFALVGAILPVTRVRCMGATGASVSHNCFGRQRAFALGLHAGSTVIRAP